MEGLATPVTAALRSEVSHHVDLRFGFVHILPVAQCACPAHLQHNNSAPWSANSIENQELQGKGEVLKKTHWV